MSYTDEINFDNINTPLFPVHLASLLCSFALVILFCSGAHSEVFAHLLYDEFPGAPGPCSGTTMAHQTELSCFLGEGDGG